MVSISPYLGAPVEAEPDPPRQKLGRSARLSIAVLGLSALVLFGAVAASAVASSNGRTAANFYAVPDAPSGSSPGKLLYSLPADSSQLPNSTDWKVAYVSRDAKGQPDVVTGTVAVPTGAWRGPGPRPIVDYAVGTQGLGTTCAPSKSFDSGLEYEDPNINSALQAGYAVVVTDYQWSGTTGTPLPTYEVGKSEGHAVLDIASASTQLQGAGLTTSAPVVVWGYSQGGGAAIWAGQQWPAYAPGVDLVGVAAGGVPGDLPTVGAALDGGFASGILLDTFIGFHSAYPDLPFTSLLNEAGKTAVNTIESQCVLGNLVSYGSAKTTSLTVGGLTFQQLLAQGNWKADLLANSPGQPGAHIATPVFNYRGTTDEVVPVAVEDAIYANLCATGTTVQSATYAGEDVLSNFEAQGDVIRFIADRVAHRPGVNSCTTDPHTL